MSWATSEIFFEDISCRSGTEDGKKRKKKHMSLGVLGMHGGILVWYKAVGVEKGWVKDEFWSLWSHT